MTAAADLEAVAREARQLAELRVAIDLLVALDGWSVADVVILVRAVRLGSPSQLASAGAAGPLADEGEEAGKPAGVRVVRPPNDEARAALLYVYRLMGGKR